jgi:hypothetical protein
MNGRREVSYAGRGVDVRPGLVYLGLAALTAVVGFGAAVPWRLTVAAAAALLLVGLVHVGRTRRDSSRRRRAANALLRTGVKVHPQSDLLVRRAAELTSHRNRRILARSLNGVVREIERPPLVTAAPLNRRGLRPHLELVRELAERLAELERPVTPQGMVLVEELLTDGYASPLYLGGAEEEVPVAIKRCLQALDSERRPRDESPADTWTPPHRGDEPQVRSGGSR